MARNVDSFKENIQNQASSIEEITAAVEEISAGSVVASISYINEISQENSMAAEELSSASAGIAFMSKDVKNRMSEFDINK